MQNSDSIRFHLQALFQTIRQAVTNGNPAAWGQLGRNAKGDLVKWFDLAADRAACDYLEHHFPAPVRLLSEEGEPRLFGAGEPEFTLVLDPVDGSENFGRAIPMSGTAIALVPGGQPVNVATVQFGLVGNLFSGKIWLAERGQGAWDDGQPIQPALASRLAEVLVSFDTNQATIEPRLGRILAQAHGARSFSAAAVVLAMVAGGTLGAHLDLTGKLTPENFLASALIITEAGGLITGPNGQPLPDIQTLTKGYPVVAAANPALHQMLVRQLQTEGVTAMPFASHK